jgi:hypothetical protein
MLVHRVCLIAITWHVGRVSPDSDSPRDFHSIQVFVDRFKDLLRSTELIRAPFLNVRTFQPKITIQHTVVPLFLPQSRSR